MPTARRGGDCGVGWPAPRRWGLRHLGDWPSAAQRHCAQQRNVSVERFCDLCVDLWVLVLAAERETLHAGVRYAAIGDGRSQPRRTTAFGFAHTPRACLGTSRERRAPMFHADLWAVGGSVRASRSWTRNTDSKKRESHHSNTHPSLCKAIITHRVSPDSVSQPPRKTCADVRLPR